MLRDFEVEPDREKRVDEKPENTFKFSWDGSFVAKRIKNGVSVYELPSMNMIVDPEKGKKSAIRVKNVSQFEWSPK